MNTEIRARTRSLQGIIRPTPSRKLEASGKVKIAPWLSLLFLISILLLTSCTSTAVATPRPVLITIGGATALQPALQELTAEYTRRHPNVLFTLGGGGSSLGEEMVYSRRIDLAASSLFPPSEPTVAQRALVRIPIGVDGLAIIVHSSNTVAGLTEEQLRGLYSGEILDWAEVGAEAGEVLLVSREDGSGSRIFFENEVMQGEPVSLTAVVMPTSRDVVDYIAKTPQAIGYVSRGYVMAQNLGRSAATSTPTAPNVITEIATPPMTSTLTTTVTATPVPGLRVRAVPVDGELPTLTALRTRSYPLIQPLYLVSRGQTWGNLRQFVDFVLSPAGQSIIRRYHLPVR
ncbi:MAG: phosphate ABC transporter substrate-binding protein [Caldilineaceae bacterium]|nr:phosphate ABC transporter substrate-binding protein [Caldilineaceae bacterium]